MDLPRLQPVPCLPDDQGEQIPPRLGLRSHPPPGTKGFACCLHIESRLLSSVSEVMLIGPDGKLVAKDLHGERIKVAVAAALGPRE